MANNIDIKDGNQLPKIVKTTEGVGGVHTPHQNAQMQVNGADVSTGNPVPVSSADIGAAADAAASSDTGTFSLIALIKRLNSKLGALGQQAMAASQPVVIASNQSNVPVAPAGPSATGSLAALNATVVLSVAGYAGAAIDLRGTFTATTTFQGTVDGTTWFSLVATPVASAANVATVSTVTAAGAWYVQCAGCAQIRAIATAYTSGTVNVTLRALTATPWVYQAPIGTTNAVTVSYTSALGTGATGTNIQSPATPAATNLKGSAGRLLGYNLVNTAAAVRWVKFFNATSVTMGTTSAVFEVPIPANGVLSLNLEGGVAFGTGIQVAVTAARGLTDNTSTGLAAGDVTGFTVHI